MEQKVNISGKKGVRTISGKERAERILLSSGRLL